MEIKEVIMPIQTDTPDRNNRMFTKEAMEKALADPRFKELGGVPVAIRKPSDLRDLSKFTTVDPESQVGLATDLDLESMMATIQLSRQSEMVTEMMGNPSFSIRPRAIGEYHNGKVEKLNIISFDIVSEQKEKKDE